VRHNGYWPPAPPDAAASCVARRPQSDRLLAGDRDHLPVPVELTEGASAAVVDNEDQSNVRLKVVSAPVRDLEPLPRGPLVEAVVLDLGDVGRGVFVGEDDHARKVEREQPTHRSSSRKSLGRVSGVTAFGHGACGLGVT
jgi:hypothetical protein